VNFFLPHIVAKPQPIGAIGIAAATDPINLGSTTIKAVAQVPAILFKGPPISKPIIQPSKNPIRKLTPFILAASDKPKTIEFIIKPKGPDKSRIKGKVIIVVAKTGMKIIEIIGVINL
jgi:hypothetical protein